MNLVYLPDRFTDEQIEQAMNLIDQQIKETPECLNHYVLVDQLGNEINIKFFKPDGVMEFCKENNITPRELMMFMMREQNQRIN